MGALIQDLRNEAGLSGADLAAVVGRSRVAVSNWEGGREMPGQDPVDAMKVRFAHKAVELQSLRDAYLEAKGQATSPLPATTETTLVGSAESSINDASFAGQNEQALNVSPGETEAGVLARSGAPRQGSRSPWLIALPILLVLGVSGVYLLLTSGQDGSVEGCNEPHPFIETEFSASFTKPTEPIPKISDDGAVAGTYSGVLGEEQLWLFVMAIDVNKYWPAEQPMALDRADKTWRLIGGSLHLGNDDPGQVGRRFEAALGVVEPAAIAQMGEANEIGGWTVDDLPEGVSLIACASVYRA